ncbi:Hypothetical protein, putative [Bodo saltans]|uniref:Uncharacterized protein n=1 Tax=Bodo saltans TaxID=75058 RepID=A0A0S4KF44_BODSA|nr:Hypothetical protein, putative [Bodo saltans]|eukprot:CUI14214.1 Hypothetical protein, putative [Bodo saltans]
MLFRQAELNHSNSSSSSSPQDFVVPYGGDTTQIIIPRASVPLPTTPQDSALDSQLEGTKNSPPSTVKLQPLPSYEAHFPEPRSFLASSITQLSANVNSIDSPLEERIRIQSSNISNPTKSTVASSPPPHLEIRRLDAFDDVSSKRRPSPEYARIELPLKEIFFYQDYISQRFMDGRLLTDTIAALQRGDLSPHTLPAIQCLKYRGRWYGMGNRRLACYHHVYRDTPDKMIPVEALELPDDEGFNALGDGKQVRVGGGLRIVEVLEKAAFEKFTPAEQELNAEVAELRAVQVYKLQHCSLYQKI